MKDLTKGNIYKTFFVFGFPLVLAGLLGQTYHIIDTMIAGRFLGEEGLATMGAISPLISIVSSLLWGFCSGFSIYIAQLFSSKNYQKMKSAIYTVIVLLFFVCLVIFLGMLVFYKPLFSFLKIAPSLYSQAFEYFFFYALGLFFIIFVTFGSFLMNALGIGSFPFFATLISSVLNIGGNLLTVAVLNLGIKGLAISTVVASIIVDICFFCKLRSCFKELGVNKEKVKISFYNIKNSLPFAIPNAFQQIMIYIAGFLLSPLVNNLGVSASASYAVVLQIYNFNAAVYQNSARAVSNYSAQCVGKHQVEKIKKGVGTGLLQGFAFLTPFLLFCSLCPEWICSLFFKADATAQVKEYSYLFAQKFLPFLYFNVICNLFHALFRGVKATSHLFFSTFFAAVVRYVVSLILTQSLGIVGFYLGWVISWIAEAFLNISLFYIGKWKPKKELV